MSIAVLTQVSDEVRRLAIAGSGLAAGDFRLKKLIGPLESAGAKAPVFARIAQAAQAVVDTSESQSAEALLSLSTLVNAVLYTQGETGLAGTLTPLETVDLGPPVTGTSARVLKPLVEALTTTGSGRMEIVKDANQRGAFRDIRLVNLAVKAIADPYPELGDYIASDVLPQYGKSIYAALRSDFDPQGRAADVRRLHLMHKLDPEATADLVQDALENGSKEVKVEAIVCLNRSDKNLPTLIEQTRARLKDVRAAALRGMARFRGDQVVEAIKSALTGKDLDIAVGPASENPSPALRQYVLDDAQRQLEFLLDPQTSKSARKGKIARLSTWLRCLQGRNDQPAVNFLLACFDRRDDIARLSEGHMDGADVNQLIAGLIVASGDDPALRRLYAAHDLLEPSLLPMAFLAAVQAATPDQVYDLFSPYLSASIGKKKPADPVRVRKELIREVLLDVAQRRLAGEQDSGTRYVGSMQSRAALMIGGDDIGADFGPVELDPRWVKLAIAENDHALVQMLAQPGDRQVDKYLSKIFPLGLSSRDAYWMTAGLLDTMVRIQHPRVEEHFLEAMQTLCARSRHDYGIYWLGRIIPRLSLRVVEPLEKLIPEMSDRVADEIIPYITELKSTA